MTLWFVYVTIEIIATFTEIKTLQNTVNIVIILSESFVFSCGAFGVFLTSSAVFIYNLNLTVSGNSIHAAMLQIPLCKPLTSTYATLSCRCAYVPIF